VKLFEQWSSESSGVESGRTTDGVMELFPHPDAWGFVRTDLASEESPASVFLDYQLAMSQGDYGRVSEIIASLKPTDSEPPSLLKMIFRPSSVSHYGGRQQANQYFWTLKLAAFHSADPDLSKSALEELLVFFGNRPDGYFRVWGMEFPDLAETLGEARSEELLTPIFSRPDPSLDVSQFVESDRGRILRILINANVVDVESFEDFIRPGTTHFDEAVQYLTASVPGFPSTEVRREWIGLYLRGGNIDAARAQIEAVKEESNSEFAPLLIELSSNVGYRYSAADLYRTIEPYLQDLSPQIRLELQARLMPLDPENDPIIAQLNEQIAAMSSPSSELLLSRIFRLFELGLVEEGIEYLDLYLAENRSFALPGDSDKGEQMARLVRLARAMQILDEPEICERLIALMLEKNDEISIDDGYYEKQRFIEFLFSAEEYELALGETVELLRDSVQQRKSSGYYSWYSRTPMSVLVTIYQQAGRSEDALYLLNRSPFWSAENLADLNHSTFGGIAFPVVVAQVLVATGNEAEGTEILRGYILEEGWSDDLAYETLVALEGVETLPFLEKLAEIDPFEERPLIWQSVIYLEEGELEMAEAAARAAIAVDPSDGEMGSRDRLRAYAVLAKVLEARGETEESEIMARVVAAVDLSEEADALRLAGMTLPALEMYEDSLRIFADAYCVQFRTGVELRAAGRIEEAEVHLRKAYGLMPLQFGRIESHCFGCEGAFRGEWEQNLALEVFTGMLQEEQGNPVLFYLMGYLEDSRGNDEAALENYAKAVELDPLYVNAWSKILQILGTRPFDTDIELRKAAIQAGIDLSPSRLTGVAREIPLEWFPVYWDSLEAGLAMMEWAEPIDFPLGTAAIPFDWGQQDYIRSDDSDDTQTESVGRIYWESTDLVDAIRSSVRGY
tara:strand:+ start:4036 stop:6747 length:2712 start_codon:yes stop_codon:yes gene_type:complete